MKPLLLTSAILLATAGTAIAQTTTSDMSGNVPGFRASKLTGMALYSLNPETVTELRAARPADPAPDARTTRWTSGETFIAGRDQWESIGDVSDVVLSQDGEIQGVLLDIGGFLGIGARTVMVGTDDLYFVSDSTTPQEPGDFFVVASMSRAQLEALPVWSDENLAAGYAWDDAQGMAAHESIVEAASAGPTAEDLTGADVRDLAGSSIGDVSDLVIEGDTIVGAVIDAGGFLGIGSKTVLVPVDTLTVVRDVDLSVSHVETTLTREQLEALPEHTG